MTADDDDGGVVVDEAVVAEFDKRVATLWLLVVVGATKGLERTIIRLSDLVTITVLGVDLTILCLYLILVMGGTTVIIAARTMD